MNQTPKVYFSFSRLRYIDKENLSPELVMKRVEQIISCSFAEVHDSHGLAEKRYEAVVLGCEVRLEHWRYNGETIYTLSGRTIVHADWEQEHIVKLNAYVIAMFDHSGMPGWYICSSEEQKRDADLSGGEHTS